MRSTWRLLNEVLNNKKFFSRLMAKKFLTQWRLQIDFDLTSKILDQTLPNEFNLPLRIKILFGDLPQSMFLNLATQEEFVDIACKFPAGKSAGYDNIPMSIIKRSTASISSPLTHIINLSIIHGIIPDELKIVPFGKRRSSYK